MAKSNVDMERNEASSKVLSALDHQKFSWYHVKAILVSGVGFLTDAYDLFSINLAVPMIGMVYFGGKMPTISDAVVKSAATIGTLLGQIIFGILADLIGRKKMYGIVLQMMIIGTFASALSANTMRGISVIHMLVFWRFLVGLGIGGDYPLSAVITSEYATVQRRGQMMAAVFAMQGTGILLASIVALTTLACFKQMINNDPLNLDYVWRICLGLGIVPAIIAVYFRHKLAETPRFTMQVKGNLSKAVSDVNKVVTTSNNNSSATLMSTDKSKVEIEVKRSSFKDFRQHFGQWKYFKVLLGCAMAWFFLDIAFYGLQLNQSDVLHSIGFVNSNATVYDQMFQNAAGNALISLMGTVPGYWFSVLLIEKMGRIKIQLLGFTVLTTIFVVLASAFHQIRNTSIALFIVLYCIALFFFNFGPNTTTFILPGEVFPTRYRSTAHGISAATGKLGAFIASLVTPSLFENYGMPVVLGVFSVFMFLGFLFTFLVPETKNKTLEALSGEEELNTSMAMEQSSISLNESTVIFGTT